MARDYLERDESEVCQEGRRLTVRPLRPTWGDVAATALVAFVAGLVFQYWLAPLGVEVCFEDDSCKVFKSAQEERAFFGQ